MRALKTRLRWLWSQKPQASATSAALSPAASRPKPPVEQIGMRGRADFLAKGTHEMRPVKARDPGEFVERDLAGEIGVEIITGAGDGPALAADHRACIDPAMPCQKIAEEGVEARIAFQDRLVGIVEGGVEIGHFPGQVRIRDHRHGKTRRARNRPVRHVLGDGPHQLDGGIERAIDEARPDRLAVVQFIGADDRQRAGLGITARAAMVEGLAAFEYRCDGIGLVGVRHIAMCPEGRAQALQAVIARLAPEAHGIAALDRAFEGHECIGCDHAAL